MAFDQAISETICERIGAGEPLRVICRDEGMPAWRTVYDWIDQQPDFAARIARARTRGFDAIAEECLDIADDPDPKLEYRVSKWNVFLALLLSETLIVPIWVLVDETKCPVAVK